VIEGLKWEAKFEGKRKIQFLPIQTLVKEITAAIVHQLCFQNIVSIYVSDFKQESGTIKTSKLSALAKVIVSNKTSILKMYTNCAFPCDF